MRNAIEVQPVSPALGGEVRGVDLAAPTDAIIESLRDALAVHSVLFVRDQSLSPEQHVSLTARLGPLLRVPYIQHLEEYPDIIAVLKEADEQRISTFGGSWHSDFSFLEQPPSFTLLYALELPPVGGDTLWASQYRAWEGLSEGMKALLSPLKAVHTGWPHGTRGPSANARVSRSVQMVRGNPAADREVEHPVVRVHPVSGRRSLFVNPVYTERFVGMTREESLPLLEFLYSHCVSPEFCCRLRWAPGTLVIWDNRSTLHLAINDYDGHRRLLHRTTVAGEVPRGVN